MVTTISCGPSSSPLRFLGAMTTGCACLYLEQIKNEITITLLFSSPSHDLGNACCAQQNRLPSFRAAATVEMPLAFGNWGLNFFSSSCFVPVPPATRTNIRQVGSHERRPTRAKLGPGLGAFELRSGPRPVDCRIPTYWQEDLHVSAPTRSTVALYIVTVRTQWLILSPADL